MKTWKEEIEKIRAAHGGMLKAKDVVAFARNKDTALHAKFEWNNTEAAEHYRLWQARQLICIYVAPADTENGLVKVREYVSLSVDRTAPGGGYRALSEVVNNEELYQQLLDDALTELQRMQEKYQRIAELRPVFVAADRVRQRAIRKPERKSA